MNPAPNLLNCILWMGQESPQVVKLVDAETPFKESQFIRESIYSLYSQFCTYGYHGKRKGMERCDRGTDQT